MRDRPPGLGDDQVALALARHWRIDAADLRYVPVGAGGYHWSVDDRDGRRWFATADDLDSKGWLGNDRDTVGLAPAERDLWMVTGGADAPARRYAAATGRATDPGLLAFYRLRWTTSLSTWGTSVPRTSERPAPRTSGAAWPTP